MSKSNEFWNTSTVVLGFLACIGLTWLIVAAKLDDTPILETGGAPVYRYFDPSKASVVYDEFKKALPVLEGENAHIGRGELKREVLTIEIASGLEVEYKAVMEQGDSIVYSWHTDGGLVWYDLHGHHEASGPDFFTRYEDGEGVARSGSILAPYTGQHGWWWVNLSEGPVRITLEVAGFYDDIVELDMNSY